MNKVRKKNKKIKIMVFGTFDVLHKGHLHFFKQAKKLAAKAYLIVSVARDINVAKIKKQKPLFTQARRMAFVKKSGLADRVVLGGIKNHLPHILKQKPQIIALGYDQTAYVAGLKEDLAKRSLKVSVVKLKPHKPKIFKSSLFKAKISTGR